MKKEYKKPSIMIENFSLATNIAGDCEVKTNTPSNEQCALMWEDEFLGEIYLFINDVSACSTKEEDGEYNSICYHVPTETNTLFNS